MTGARVSRQVVEVVVDVTPNARVSRQVVEVVYDDTGYTQLTATVPATTAEVTILVSGVVTEMQLTATVPATTMQFNVVPVTETQLTATVPATTAQFSAELGDLTYVDAVLAIDGLVGYWRMGDPVIASSGDPGTGATDGVHDSSGLGHHGNYVGLPYLTESDNRVQQHDGIMNLEPGNKSSRFYDNVTFGGDTPPGALVPHASWMDLDHFTLIAWLEGDNGFDNTFTAVGRGSIAQTTSGGSPETDDTGGQFQLVLRGNYVSDPSQPDGVRLRDSSLRARIEGTPTPVSGHITNWVSFDNITVPAGPMFVALRWDGTTCRLFVNGVWHSPIDVFGVEQPTWVIEDRLRLDDSPLYVGQAEGNGWSPSQLGLLTDEVALYDTGVSDADVEALYFLGFVNKVTVQAIVPKTTASVTILPEWFVQMQAKVPKTTAQFSAYTSPGLQVTAVVPATTASFVLDVAPAAALTAVVPVTTAAFEVAVAPEIALTAIVPATTAQFGITTVREIRVQATVPKTTAQVTMQTTRSLEVTAIVPPTEMLFELAAEAFLTLTATVPKTTALVQLAFPPATDKSNRVGGRSRGGMAVASWLPPVVPLPERYAAPFRGQRDVAQAFTVPTMGGADGTQPQYDVQLADRVRLLDRIIVGGQDVTYFRGVPTPFPGYSLVEPLLYGPTSLAFPQIAAAFEQIGVGELRWLRAGARVTIQRVDPDTLEVYATDYKGVVIGFGADGGALTVDVGGEAQGRAALVNRQVPIWTSTQDIGRYAYSAIKELGLRLTPYLGPTTGIRIQRFGGQSVLDYISEMLARAWNREGNQWTIMPDHDEATDGVYKMKRKDTTTIRGTVYADDARVVASLTRDLAEEPNRIYMTGVTPGGQRVRFGVYPGLRQGAAAPYPFDDGRDFGVGTTNGDTDTGDGITVMIQRLIVVKYLDQEDTPGGYDNGVRRAVMNLQEDAGRSFVTGTMDEDTWKALYDLDVTGYSLRWSHIEPAAQRSRVRKWNRSGSGAIMGRNPHYDPAALKVDVNLDVGSGFTRDQMREYGQAELETEDNWTGTISFPMGALVKGSHTPGDPLTEGDVLYARDLRPGDNLELPLFQGGITVHIAAASVDGAGAVSVDVDTRARDAMKVWEVIARNRESRNNPARAWMQEHRSSTMTKDSMGIWDEVGGILGDPIQVDALKWRVFPVVAGQEGTVRSIRLRTSPAAEYVLGVFGDTIYAERLAALIGNPLTKAGSKRWEDESVRDALDKRNILLYVAGSDDEPCGYFPKTKHPDDDPDTDADESTTTNALTGRWEDDAGFSYHTGQNPVLWVAIFTSHATTIPSGRIMWNQLEAGV